MNKIVLSDRMLVPKEIMPLKAVKSRYNIALYKEKDCVKCENLPERHNDICDTCPSFIAKYKLYKELPNHWSLPQGDYASLAKLLKSKDIDFKTVDKRPDLPFKFKIKFTGELFGKGYIDENGIPRTNQKKLTKKFLEKKSGIICAAPRSGKTVMFAYCSIKLGQKIIVLADRKELIKQFYNTFMGSKKRKAMSNIPELQEQTGKEIIRIVNSPKDLKNLKDIDILLVNYQKFVRNPKSIISIVNGRFGTLGVDEVHGSGADGYLRVVSSCAVKYRISLTATPRRKDNRHKLIHRIMGPVVAKSKSTSLLPTVVMKFSQIQPPRTYKYWHHAIAWISSNVELQKEIIKQAFKDLRDGHEVIIIPLDRRKHINMLTKMINHQAKLNNKKKGENWPKNLAIKYYDGVDRDKVLEKVDKKGPTILIAMRGMIKQGIDFQRPSMLYCYIPMSASTDKDTGAPMFLQLTNRICTPYKKPDPIARVWVHNIGMFAGCITGLGWQEIVPNRAKGKEGRYIIDDKFFSDLKKISVKKQNSTSKSFDWA